MSSPSLSSLCAGPPSPDPSSFAPHGFFSRLLQATRSEKGLKRAGSGRDAPRGARSRTEARLALLLSRSWGAAAEPTLLGVLLAGKDVLLRAVQCGLEAGEQRARARAQGFLADAATGERCPYEVGEVLEDATDEDDCFGI